MVARARAQDFSTHASARIAELGAAARSIAREGTVPCSLCLAGWRSSAHPAPVRAREIQYISDTVSSLV